MLKRKPIVLFTTPILGHPPIGGPRLRIENSIKALSQISDLYLYSRVSLADMGNASALAFYEKYCRKFYFAPEAVPENRAIGYVRAAVNLFSQKALQRNLFTPGQGVRRIFRSLLDTAGEIKADVIWLGFGNISYPLLKYIKDNSDYKVVLDTDSVWSRFVLRGASFITDGKGKKRLEKESRTKEAEEKWGTQLADVTTAVSEFDAQYYRSLAANPERVHIFSNVVDVEAYGQRVAPAPGFKKPCIFLAGTFYSPQCPMTDAVRWMISQILPLVRRQIPDIHCYIVGKGSTEFLADIKDPGITITGKVPSVLPYLCHADVSAVPLRYESGTRFKILEAGACGIPVVSTTLGAEGLAVTHQKDIIIADTPEDFAGAVAALVSNPDLARKLAKNLKDLVNERYSVSTLAEEGRRILEYLL